MNSIRGRSASIAVVAFVALGGAVAALAATGERQQAVHTHAHAAYSLTPRQLVLRNDMRQLWEDHIVWTRLAIISLTTGSPDTQATVARLLQNQTDIGNAVKPFYGRAAGERLTAELRKHILIAADLIAAARAGDTAKLAEEQARWQANADDIAAVLNSVNPRYFKLATMKAEMRKHLALTTAEAVARLEGNWAADVVAYDRIHAHALHMADLLSTGLVKQFPRRFR